MRSFFLSTIKTKSASGFSAEYMAILTEAISQGYTLPTPGQQVKQNQVILELKGAGVWAKHDRIWVMCTDGSSTFTFLNWRNPTGAKIESVGSPVFTENSGWRANGTTNYLSSNFNFSNDAEHFTQNDASYTLGLVAPTNGQGAYVFGSQNAASTGIDFIRFNSNVIQSSLNNVRATSSNTFQNGDFAIFTANRLDDSGYTMYRDATPIQTVTASSTALPSNNLPICAIRNQLDVVPASMNSGSLQFLAFGASLTESEISAFQEIMSTYINDPS